MRKKVLVLQFRPEKEVSDDEFNAFIKYGNLYESEVERIEAHDGFDGVVLDNYSAVVVGGSPYTISDKKKDVIQERVENKLSDLMCEIKNRDFPYWGNCYGLGSMVHACGGEMSKEKYSEDVGAVVIKLNDNVIDDEIFDDIPREFYAFVGHKEACQMVPLDALLLASSDTCLTQLMRYGKNVYVSQFHAELDSNGLEIRINFYKDKGYFPPEDADRLIEAGYKHKVVVPMKVFSNFIEKYHFGQDSFNNFNSM